jgi:hypothetical protein
MDGFDELLATARTAYARGDWHAAHRQLTQAGTLSELVTADSSLPGGAAWWPGRAKESLEISEEVYHRFQDSAPPRSRLLAWCSPAWRTCAAAVPRPALPSWMRQCCRCSPASCRDAAEHAIEQSGAELVGRNNWVAGEAFYQLGEIRRLRGDNDGAEKAYARARELGTEPQPGESLLQQAAGKNAAWAGLVPRSPGGTGWHAHGCWSPASKSPSPSGTWTRRSGCAASWRKPPPCSPPPASARGPARPGPPC